MFRSLSDGWWLAIPQITNHITKLKYEKNTSLQAIKQFIDLINLQHHPRKVITPETAIQYLSARKFDIPKAVALYEANNSTRQREGLFGIDSKSDPLRNELETGKFTVLVSWKYLRARKGSRILPLFNKLVETSWLILLRNFHFLLKATKNLKKHESSHICLRHVLT